MSEITRLDWNAWEYTDVLGAMVGHNEQTGDLTVDPFLFPEEFDAY